MKILYVKNPGAGYEYIPGSHAWVGYPSSIAQNSGYIPGSHAWGLPSAIANRQQTKEQRIPQQDETKKAMVKTGREQMKKITNDSLLTARFMAHISR